MAAVAPRYRANLVNLRHLPFRLSLCAKQISTVTSRRRHMRSLAATPVLALFRFLFFTALPLLVGLCGASVACDTNCFSVGKRLKSGPYSRNTTSSVATPIESMPVRSTPLIRVPSLAHRLFSPPLDRVRFRRVLHWGRLLSSALLPLQSASFARFR
jgi:hypothetical protein